MNRPWLFLDVDGVLNPFVEIERLPPGYALHDVIIAPDSRQLARSERGRELTIALNTAHGEWLRDLAVDFDLVWATAWGEHANEHISPRLGLPRLPVVIPHPLGLYRSAKRPAIIDFAKERPLAWIDDAINSIDFQWARSRRGGSSGVPTRLVKVRPEVGLTEAHIEELRRFAQSLRNT